MATPRLLSIGITPSSEGDSARLEAGLASMMREDPSLAIVTNGDEIIVAGIGELQLEIVIDRLKREFNVNARLGRPSVIYAETITATAVAEVKYADLSSHQYAHVKIRIEPCEPGNGYVFADEVTGGAVPSAFVAAVDAGVRSELDHGILAGHRVVDVRVVLYDGSYHDSDSSDAAFRIAAARAFREAALRAAPVVLEPVMHVEAIVPTGDGDEVAKNLAARRGRPYLLPQNDDYCTVVAYAPLSALWGYAADLRRITAGKGSCTMRFAEYARVPHGDGSDADRDASVGAPLRPRPAPRTSSIALPEPTEYPDDL